MARLRKFMLDGEGDASLPLGGSLRGIDTLGLFDKVNGFAGYLPIEILGAGYHDTGGSATSVFNADMDYALNVWLGGAGPYDIRVGDVLYFLFGLTADVSVTPPEPFGTEGWVADREFQVTSGLWGASMIKIVQPEDISLGIWPFTFSASAKTMMMVLHTRNIRTTGDTVLGSEILTYVGQSNHPAPAVYLYGTAGEQKALSIQINKDTYTTFIGNGVDDSFDEQNNNLYNAGAFSIVIYPVIRTFQDPIASPSSPITYKTYAGTIDSAVLAFPLQPAPV
jgi:hypothetical protein